LPKHLKAARGEIDTIILGHAIITTFQELVLRLTSLNVMMARDLRNMAIQNVIGDGWNRRVSILAEVLWEKL
jgi:hypothetical protein